MNTPLEELEIEILRLTNIIEAPLPLLPTFGHTTDTGLPHVEFDGQSYHVVEIERGAEWGRRSSKDFDEVVFWILEFVTFEMASDYAAEHRTDDQEFRSVLFIHQVHLMEKMNIEFAGRLRAKYSKLLGPTI